MGTGGVVQPFFHPPWDGRGFHNNPLSLYIRPRGSRWCSLPLRCLEHIFSFFYINLCSKRGRLLVQQWEKGLVFSLRVCLTSLHSSSGKALSPGRRAPPMAAIAPRGASEALREKYFLAAADPHATVNGKRVEMVGMAKIQVHQEFIPPPSVLRGGGQKSLAVQKFV